MNFQRKAIPAALMMILLSGCGGGSGGGDSSVVSTPPTDTSGNNNTDADSGNTDGGGDGTVGISGSGAPVALGTIDGFGSIFVNGVEFETDDASIIIDGEEGTEDDLGVGMVVIVQGSVNADNTTGTADVVIFDDEVEGPISAIEINQDGDAKRIAVLGIQIIVERTGTVFEDVTFESLAVDDVVEVSGFVEGNSTLRATRIERKGSFQEGTTAIELKGEISNLGASEFTLSGFVVDFSSAVFDDGATVSDLVDGVVVEVKGTLANSRISATEVELEDDFIEQFDDDDELRVQGLISNFVGLEAFDVKGVTVDATNAVLRPAGLVLNDGVAVEVKGVLSGGILQASEIESRRGRIELEAAVREIDADSDTITLGFSAGDISFQVDVRTLFDDDTDQLAVLTLADLAIGDFLEVEAYQDGDQLIATRVDREDSDEEMIQAPVEGFTEGSDITVLGVTFGVVGAEFESLAGGEISSSAFFQQVQIGDLVKIEDDEPADGVADSIEFEADDRLDGGIEFDDEDDDEEDEDEQDESDENEDDSEDSGDDDESDGESEDDASEEDEDDSEDSGDDDEFDGESGDDASEDDEDESEDSINDELDSEDESDSEDDAEDASDDDAEDSVNDEADDSGDLLDDNASDTEDTADEAESGSDDGSDDVTAEGEDEVDNSDDETEDASDDVDDSIESDS